MNFVNNPEFFIVKMKLLNYFIVVDQKSIRILLVIMSIKLNSKY